MTKSRFEIFMKITVESLFLEFSGLRGKTVTSVVTKKSDSDRFGFDLGYINRKRRERASFLREAREDRTCWWFSSVESGLPVKKVESC